MQTGTFLHPKFARASSHKFFRVLPSQKVRRMGHRRDSMEKYGMFVESNCLKKRLSISTKTYSRSHSDFSRPGALNLPQDSLMPPLCPFFSAANHRPSIDSARRCGAPMANESMCR
jgi:hypothetical protein